MLLPHDYHLTIHKAPKSQWQHRIRLSIVFFLLVNLPALYKCRYASEQSSVCIPRSLRSVSAISSPRALGILPIPSCRVAPSHMYGRSNNNMVEFIVDAGRLNSMSRRMGDVSYSGFEGSVTNICKIY